jgi:hypothetical protein
MALIIRMRNALTGDIIKEGTVENDSDLAQFWDEEFHDFDVSTLEGRHVASQPMKILICWNLVESITSNILELGLTRKGIASYLENCNIRHGQAPSEPPSARLPWRMRLLPEMPRHNAGWRRWYREFTIFCISVPMIVQDQNGQDVISSTLKAVFFNGVDIRQLVPLILQSAVAKYRLEANLEHRRQTGMRIRSSEGALHGITHRTGAKYMRVVKWAEEWEEKNQHILRAIKDAVELHPNFTYFK